MSLADGWRAAKRTLRAGQRILQQEQDERTEQVWLLASRDALVVALLTVSAASGFIAIWPMSDQQQLIGFRVLPLLVLMSAFTASGVSAHRRGWRPSREARQASRLRDLAYLPVSVLAFGGGIFVLSRDLAPALWTAFGVLVLRLVVAAVGYWRAGRKSTRTGA